MISIGSIIGGFLLCALAATGTFESPLSTLFIVGGLIVAGGGFISLVLILKGKV